MFTITNTSKTDPDTKQGAVFRTKDIKLEDSTIVGDGEVVDLKYPADWDTKVLKPGESVEVTGTLKGVTKTHTDRAKVTGTPLTECPVDTSAPFGDGTSDDESGSKPEAETESKSDDVVTIDGKDYCSDTKVESATDDWNGYRRTRPDRRGHRADRAGRGRRARRRRGPHGRLPPPQGEGPGRHRGLGGVIRRT